MLALLSYMAEASPGWVYFLLTSVSCLSSCSRLLQSCSCGGGGVGSNQRKCTIFLKAQVWNWQNITSFAFYWLSQFHKGYQNKFYLLMNCKVTLKGCRWREGWVTMSVACNLLFQGRMELGLGPYFMPPDQVSFYYSSCSSYLPIECVWMSIRKKNCALGYVLAFKFWSR